MYEGPNLGHLLAYQLFIRPFLRGRSLMDKITGFKYDYYLWYSDSTEIGGIHGGYYVDKDMARATEHGKKIFFDEEWLARWYSMIDNDCKEVEKIMERYKLEDKIDSFSKNEIISLIPSLIDIEYRLASFMRCSQPQLTDALKNQLYSEIRKILKDERLVEEVFVALTIPEEKSFFTHEELAWLEIVIEAKNIIHEKDINYLSQGLLSDNYNEILVLLKEHYRRYRLIPASDRTPAWDIDHFIFLLKTSLKNDIDYKRKRQDILNQYENAVKTKKEIIERYGFSEEVLGLAQKISKVGFYRFKSGFFWRWIGYYLVLILKKYSEELALSYEEISSMTKDELISALEGKMIVEKEELARRAEAELYLHYEGKDYIWWGKEALEKKAEILGAVDYDKLKEMKGEIGNTGFVRGKAFVFYWSDDVSKKVHEMPEGSILVAPQTHPTYMPAIRLCKALVCDEGGVTGHAAIVSRELNKPCVIGLHIATKAIKTGDLVEVDANKGVVKILK